MTMEKLRKVLREHGTDLECFGVGSAKTLADLHAEIANGETLLVEVDGHLVRRVSVLGVDVFANIEGERIIHLVEDRQVFADGRVRRRTMPTSISEKLHPGEDPLEAVTRALDEEINISEFTLLTPTPRKRVEKGGSQSYPGILSEYTKYEVDVLIAPSEYLADGYREIQVGNKVTHFLWVT